MLSLTLKLLAQVLLWLLALGPQAVLPMRVLNDGPDHPVVEAPMDLCRPVLGGNGKFPTATVVFKVRSVTKDGGEPGTIEHYVFEVELPSGKFYKLVFEYLPTIFGVECWFKDNGLKEWSMTGYSDVPAACTNWPDDLKPLAAYQSPIVVDNVVYWVHKTVSSFVVDGRKEELSQFFVGNMKKNAEVKVTISPRKFKDDALTRDHLRSKIPFGLW